MANVAIEHAQDTMKKTEAALERNLATIRAGRANAGLLSHISVEYYAQRHCHRWPQSRFPNHVYCR